MLDKVTHLVLTYQSLGKHFDLLMNEINLHIYEYPGKRYELPEEEWGDFFLSIQQRVGSLIQGFEYRGFSFLTYLNRTLQWHLKSYRRREKKRVYSDWVLERESIVNFPENAEWCGESYSMQDKILNLINRPELPRKRKKVLCSRLFFLLLKNILFLTEEEFLECAAFMGYDSDSASKYRIQLLEQIRPRIARQELLIQRRNHCHHRVAYCEKQLMDYPDREKKEELLRRIERFKAKKVKMNDQIRRICVLPTNREISSVLRIPKGSVDSGLYYLKKHLGSYEKRMNLVR